MELESKVARSVVAMLIVVGLIITTASEIAEAPTSEIAPNGFKQCYPPCFIGCMVAEKNLLKCAWSCLKQCVFHHPPINALVDAHIQQAHYYCKLGCASSKCTSISAPQSPNEDAVEGCVKSCNEFCATNRS